MAIGCGAKCAKILLIIFNFIFWLSGAAILAIGIWMLVAPENAYYLEILKIPETDEMLKYASYVLIAVGAIVFIVGFLGCCGAIQESKCMLVSYFICLILILGAEIAAGILGVIYKDKIKENVDTKVPEMIQKQYLETDYTSLTKAWDWLQIEAKCCGYNGPDDYDAGNVKRLLRELGKDIPDSCCVLMEDSTVEDIKPKDVEKCQQMEDQYFNEMGCKEQIMTWFDDHVIIIIGLGLGIGCLELFGMIFAICLCRNIGEEV